MMRNIDEARKQYIDRYLENAKLIHYRDIDSNEYPIKKVFYDDLHKTSLKGYFPFASEYVNQNLESVSHQEDGKLMYYFLPNVHELYIGTTGSGKTTGCVEPQLRGITSMKDKPNLFLTDPKGELFERNAKHLKQSGYDIFLLNFKDNIKSDRWNPLLEIYDHYQRLNTIGKNYQYMVGKPPKATNKYNDSSTYLSDYIMYDDYAFSTFESFELYVTYQKDEILLIVEDLVTQIANMIVNIRSEKDPTWEEGANRLLKGLIYALLEDSLIPEREFTRDMMSFKTIRDLYNALRQSFSNNDSGTYSLVENPPFKHKQDSDYSIELMRQACENAPNTTRSYLGVFETSIQNWTNLKILSLTTGHTMNLNMHDKPYAIFLITRDYEKSDFTVAGLFIDWVYRQTLEFVEKHGVNRETHFMLDEFGNVPVIRDFENKISTARSRQIWFHLVVQSYAQIAHVYDANSGSQKSEIIKDNCNSQIFLGAQNFDTKERFSRECGDHSILSFDTYFGQKQNQFDRVRLIPVSKLDLLKPGNMYIKRSSLPVIESSFVRSYLVKEYQVDHKNGFDIVKPNGSSFNARQFTYHKIFEKTEKAKFKGMLSVFDDDDD